MHAHAEDSIEDIRATHWVEQGIQVTVHTALLTNPVRANETIACVFGHESYTTRVRRKFKKGSMNNN